MEKIKTNNKQSEKENIKIEKTLSEKQTHLLKLLKVLYMSARQANLSGDQHDMIKAAASELEQEILAWEQ